jgi:hypothetical protein
MLVTLSLFERLRALITLFAGIRKNIFFCLLSPTLSTAMLYYAALDKVEQSVRGDFGDANKPQSIVRNGERNFAKIAFRSKKFFLYTDRLMVNFGKSKGVTLLTAN